MLFIVKQTHQFIHYNNLNLNEKEGNPQKNDEMQNKFLFVFLIPFNKIGRKNI